MREKEKFQKFCAKCGSTELKIPTTPWKTAEFGQFLSGEMKCTECGFEGIVFEGNKRFITDYKKQMVGK